MRSPKCNLKQSKRLDSGPDFPQCRCGCFGGPVLPTWHSSAGPRPGPAVCSVGSCLRTLGPRTSASVAPTCSVWTLVNLPGSFLYVSHPLSKKHFLTLKTIGVSIGTWQLRRPGVLKKCFCPWHPALHSKVASAPNVCIGPKQTMISACGPFSQFELCRRSSDMLSDSRFCKSWFMLLANVVHTSTCGTAIRNSIPSLPGPLHPGSRSLARRAPVACHCAPAMPPAPGIKATAF